MPLSRATTVLNVLPLLSAGNNGGRGGSALFSHQRQWCLVSNPRQANRPLPTSVDALAEQLSACRSHEAPTLSSEVAVALGLAASASSAYGHVAIYSPTALQQLRQLLTATVYEARDAAPSMILLDDDAPLTLFQLALRHGHLDVAATLGWLASTLAEIGRCLPYWLHQDVWPATGWKSGREDAAAMATFTPAAGEGLLLLTLNEAADSSGPALAVAADLQSGVITSCGVFTNVATVMKSGPAERLLASQLTPETQHCVVTTLLPMLTGGPLLSPLRHPTSSASTDGLPPTLTLPLDFEPPDELNTALQRPERWCVLDPAIFDGLSDVVAGHQERPSAVLVWRRHLGPGGRLLLQLDEKTHVPAHRDPILGTNASHLPPKSGWLAEPENGGPHALSDVALAHALRGTWAVYNDDTDQKKERSFAYCMVIDTDSAGRVFGMECPWSWAYAFDTNPFPFR